jgi:hypothetical protein
MSANYVVFAVEGVGMAMASRPRHRRDRERERNIVTPFVNVDRFRR